MSTARKTNTRLHEEEAEELKKVAIKSSNKAVRASKAMGLTIMLISDNKIIEKSPTGEKRVVKKLDIVPIDQSQKGLKKGTVLYKK